MLCHEFEDRLTDYLDGALEVHANREFAEHAMRCPVCHDLLSEVKNTLLSCSASEVPVPDAALEARILLKTMPETAISCVDFEAHLTDYLDGFLVAPRCFVSDCFATIGVSCHVVTRLCIRVNEYCFD